MAFSGRPVFGGGATGQGEDTPVKMTGFIPDVRTTTTMGHTSEKPSIEYDD